MALKINTAGDAYMLSCTGAEKEQIFFYPSINNVPLGGQGRYEVTTTLCPGKSSCKGNKLALAAKNLLHRNVKKALTEIIWQKKALFKFRVYEVCPGFKPQTWRHMC